jgi:CRISPR/Cas system CMR subunit Cmr4 (Cas7 group RAMP superfamily)
MLSNQVDATFSDKDLQEIMNALALVSQKLNFAVGLSSEERQGIAKIGRKSQTFTEGALDMAEAHPELMPAGVSIPGARQDMNLFVSLNPVVQKLGELYHLAKDTQTVAGSEAFAAARVAYNSAKTFGAGMGLDDVIKDLSLRFKKAKSPLQSEE